MLKKLYIFIILTCSFTSAFAQSGASLGMRSMTAISRGVDAVYWNPANLARREIGDKDFQLVLYSLNFGLGNNSFSYNSIEKYIGDGESIYLTNEDKDDILDLIDDDGLKFDIALNASVLTWSYKNFGFGIETRSFGDVSIPKHIYENILVEFGNKKYDYSVKGSGYLIGKYKLSYGTTLINDILIESPLLGSIIFNEINVGVSLAYLQGHGYARIENGTATLDISDNGILPVVDVSAKRADKGRGMGLDLGLGLKTRQGGYQFAAVIENLFAQINWYGGTEMSRAKIDFGTQPLFLVGDGQLSDIDIDSVSTDTTMAISSFRSKIPVNFRLALAKQIKKVILNLEFGRENRFYGTSLGCKFDLGVFNLFGSVSKTHENVLWGFAFAIDAANFYIDFGTSSRSGLSLASSKGVFYGSSMKIRF
ncbi:hypothetical protein JXB12_06450 [candidate division KSB1 bacterium]|nr:hypothetical protein [candidate division KSB1 bacterium]